MKRTILSLLAFMVVMVVWADDITAQQALQQAQSFIQQRETVGSRPKRIKGSPMKLTMVKQVSGLYLFNINDNGGFVIVSNDDRTRPILGFSDSGAIDPDNMPSNMRAWLQGYADEIAWAKQHNIATVTNVGKATSTGPVNAPRRVGSHSTKSIAPLVSTTWNQDAPYNNMTPYYSVDQSTGSVSYSSTGGTYHCATGCVATAMAQVMKYHEWPKNSTTSIPLYQWGNAGITLSSLSATTFDWDNMLDSYSGSYTTAQANAVATLMKYCGWSVKMNYGPSSGSNTDKVAEALRDYFDYNSTTTQFVSRSFYNAAKWADLIYYELAHNRPVVYGGQSSGGGHEFVCDGYKYEDSTDFFHINWGWGGQSDEYFVLSALDPDSQGIGGSSSTDGFHYGQDAVIGIQPSTSSGSTANITPNDINLTANSMTVDSNPACYMPLNVTVNVTNNSSEDYDGDISIGRKNGNTYYLIAGDNCDIPAGATRDVVIPFIPDEVGTYTIMPFDGASMSIGEAISFTVTAADINPYVPVYGYYCDEYSRSQFIIPASEMPQESVNGTLNSVTFYGSTISAIDWGSAQFDVYLKEVGETTLSSMKDWSSLNKVYSGSLSVGSDGKMVITFPVPYEYDGGNLLVGINQITKGNYANVYWVGTEATGASLGGYNTSIAQQDFLPFTSFDYTPGTGSSIPKPTSLTINYSGGRTAIVTWTSSESAFDINVNETVTQNVASPYTLNNLELGTTYNVKVRAKNGNDVSDWSKTVSFTTDIYEDMCQISFELTDSYGDGWNGAAIKVVDVLTGEEIGTVSNTNDAGAGVAQNYQIAVPDDRDIQFVWISGKYDSECSYVVYDVNGNVILSGSGAMNSPVTYHVDCTYAPTPKDIVVTPSATTAEVAWTGYAANYEVRYGKAPDGSGVVPEWLQYDNGTYMSSIGNETSGTWTWGLMFPGNQVTGDKLTKISWYEISNYITGDITVNIYSGGNTAPGTLLHSLTVSPNKNYEFHEVTLPSPVTITRGENLWITLTATGTYVISTCTSTEPNNQWIYGGSSWTNIGNLSSSFANYGWMIRACIDAMSIDENEVVWKTVSTNTPSCNLTGLSPKTMYALQVRGDFASDGYSLWSASTIFTTLEQTIIPGDANGDGSVTFADVMAIVNYLLGKPSGSFVLDGADFNGDGKVTISDAVGLLYYLKVQ